jgi:hypothetical protein
MTLTSEPARHKVFQLEAAHGRGQAAPRLPRARAMPTYCLRGMARGPKHAAESGRLGTHGRSYSKPSGRVTRGPALQPGKCQASDTTPPVDLKGAALRRSASQTQRVEFPGPSLLAFVLARCRTSASLRRKCHWSLQLLTLCLQGHF